MSLFESLLIFWGSGGSRVFTGSQLLRVKLLEESLAEILLSDNIL